MGGCGDLSTFVVLPAEGGEVIFPIAFALVGIVLLADLWSQDDGRFTSHACPNCGDVHLIPRGKATKKRNSQP